ncbi:FliM/FliN family flagellar motor switch protein [Aurantimonas sp. VKM B-3413]|uniref:FliM/FliN family flagellar motor switch protein n=1 Tax=Aurantimonas sp. VKM B-3413 TaxID=2779401 RepID=UPI001E46DB88|nr:FliM/FliN family flagellar motor switch protein [Aurantimonas sp. VKM B-3413]MCB8837936.1 FliM/FliN family flagellar motor switch protein [Aurantimonas sp. VKM B-3413]
MSETALASDPADIGARLRSASEIDPRRLPRLLRMAEDWAAATQERLSSLCVQAVEMEFSECEIEDIPELDDPAVKAGLLAPIESRRFAHPGFALLPRTAIEAVIAAFFGAEPSAAVADSRSPTVLDKRLMKLALATILEAAEPIFEPFGELHLSAEEFTDAAELAEAMGENPGRFVLFRFKLVVADFETPVSIALPIAFFAPHRRYLAVPPEPQQLDPDETWSKAIEASFARSDLRLEAVLCKKKIPLSQVGTFRVGSTVSLDVALTSLISVQCEDRPLFRAQVGRSRDKYVVKIDERIDPAQEFFDDILSD